MAKADDASSTIDRIPLRDAKELAAARFMSERLAKKKLREWLASKELPWGCMSWDGQGLDAKGLAEMRTPSGFRDSKGATLTSIPSTVYCPGDPGFWRAKTLEIDWEDNRARDVVSYGAEAEGIFVTHSRLLELLHEGPREHVETRKPIKPAEQKVEPKVWLAKVRNDHRQQPGEGTDAYARRLHVLMQKPAAGVTKIWLFKTLKRRLSDK